MKLKLNGKQVFLIGSVIGGLVFLYIYGYKILDVVYDEWLVNNGGDTSQHYLGWVFYRKTPWAFPVGLLQGVTYPRMFSITYMDSIPILAFIFKIFSSLLPSTFQYFGFFGLLTYMLQGGISASIIYFLTENWKASIIGCLFFVFSTVLMQRMFNHTALAFHPLILTSIFLYFYKDHLIGSHKDFIAWTTLLVVSSLIHIYFVPMVVIFMCGFYFFDVFSKKNCLKGIAKIIFAIVITLIVVYLKGDFYGNTNFVTSGLGAYNSNLNALLNDQGVSFIDRLMNETSSGRGEEFAYLGVGTILLCIISLVILFQNYLWLKFNKKNLPLVLIVITLIFLSIQPTVKIGNFSLYEISYPEQIKSLLGVFRANGRFMWPVFYLVMTGSIVCVTNNYKKFGVYVVFAMLAVQLLDLSQNIHSNHNFWKHVATKNGNILQSNVWDQISTNEIYFFYNPVGNVNMMRATFCLGKYAADHDMVMNDFYVSRKNDKDILAARNLEYSKILEGEADKDKLYVFSSLPVELIYNDNVKIHIYEIDGIIVGVTKKIDGLTEYTGASEVELTYFEKLGIINGKVTDEGRILNVGGGVIWAPISHFLQEDMMLFGKGTT